MTVMLLSSSHGSELCRFIAPAVLYFGPETLWPVSSFLAAMIGIILTFWRHLVDVARRLFTGAKQTAPSDRGRVDPLDVDISITTASRPAQRGGGDPSPSHRAPEGQ